MSYSPTNLSSLIQALAICHESISDGNNSNCNNKKNSTVNNNDYGVKRRADHESCRSSTSSSKILKASRNMMMNHNIGSDKKYIYSNNDISHQRSARSGTSTSIISSNLVRNRQSLFAQSSSVSASCSSSSSSSSSSSTASAASPKKAVKHHHISPTSTMATMDELNKYCTSPYLPQDQSSLSLSQHLTTRSSNHSSRQYSTNDQRMDLDYITNTCSENYDQDDVDNLNLVTISTCNATTLSKCSNSPGQRSHSTATTTKTSASSITSTLTTNNIGLDTNRHLPSISENNVIPTFESRFTSKGESKSHQPLPVNVFGGIKILSPTHYNDGSKNRNSVSTNSRSTNFHLPSSDDGISLITDDNNSHSQYYSPFNNKDDVDVSTKKRPPRKQFNTVYPLVQKSIKLTPSSSPRQLERQTYRGPLTSNDAAKQIKDVNGSDWYGLRSSIDSNKVKPVVNRNNSLASITSTTSNVTSSSSFDDDNNKDTTYEYGYYIRKSEQSSSTRKKAVNRIDTSGRYLRKYRSNQAELSSPSSFNFYNPVISQSISSPLVITQSVWSTEEQEKTLRQNTPTTTITYMTNDGSTRSNRSEVTFTSFSSSTFDNDVSNRSNRSSVSLSSFVPKQLINNGLSKASVSLTPVSNHSVDTFEPFLSPKSDQSTYDPVQVSTIASSVLKKQLFPIETNNDTKITSTKQNEQPSSTMNETKQRSPGRQFVSALRSSLFSLSPTRLGNNNNNNKKSGTSSTDQKRHYSLRYRLSGGKKAMSEEERKHAKSIVQVDPISTKSYLDNKTMSTNGTNGQTIKPLTTTKKLKQNRTFNGSSTGNESKMQLEATATTTSPFSSRSSQCVLAILLLEPKQRIFEVVFLPTINLATATIGEVISLARANAVDTTLSEQKYSSLCNSGQEIGALLLPVHFLIPNGNDDDNKKNHVHEDSKTTMTNSSRTILLVAVPVGHTAKAMQSIKEVIWSNPKTQRWWEQQSSNPSSAVKKKDVTVNE